LESKLKVLICGGRDYDPCKVQTWLDKFPEKKMISSIIQGGATGADRGGYYWACENDIEVETFMADWDKHGKSAGPIRNREMIKQKPDLVIAFPGGKGTEDMISMAEKAGVRVITVDRP
jgi:hypothetical protein